MPGTDMRAVNRANPCDRAEVLGTGSTYQTPGLDGTGRRTPLARRALMLDEK